MMAYINSVYLRKIRVEAYHHLHIAVAEASIVITNWCFKINYNGTSQSCKATAQFYNMLMYLHLIKHNFLSPKFWDIQFFSSCLWCFYHSPKHTTSATLTYFSYLTSNIQYAKKNLACLQNKKWIKTNKRKDVSQQNTFIAQENYQIIFMLKWETLRKWEQIIKPKWKFEILRLRILHNNRQVFHAIQFFSKNNSNPPSPTVVLLSTQNYWWLLHFFLCLLWS